MKAKNRTATRKPRKVGAARDRHVERVAAYLVTMRGGDPAWECHAMLEDARYDAERVVDLVASNIWDEAIEAASREGTHIANPYRTKES